MSFYHHHFQSLGTDSSSSFFGAFAGAFFAFVFGLITYIVTKRRERFVQHKNALVKLERILHKHLQDLGALEVLVKNMDIFLGQGKVDITRLFKIEIPEGIDMEIGSLDLINKFLTYQINLDRLNFNASSVNHALTRIEDLFINNHPVEVENFNLVRRLLKGFGQDLPKITERTLKFLVLIRIHNNKTRNRNTFVYGVLNTLWDQDISDEEIKSERKKLDEEIKVVATQDSLDVF